jgi:putative peptide zinc metalloprotease protein
MWVESWPIEWGELMFGERLRRAEHKTDTLDRAVPSGLWQRLELRLPGDTEAGLLWPQLEQRLAAVPDCPCLRSELVLKPLPAADGSSYLLSDLAGGRYFRLGEREAAILALLDGQHEVVRVVADCSAHGGSISALAVEQFVQDLRLAGLLQERASLWQRLSSPRRHGPVILWMLPAAEEKLARLAGRLGPLAHPLAGGVILALFLFDLVTLGLRWYVLQADWGYLSSAWGWTPLLLILLYISMVPVILTHEVAHALACSHFGGRVSRLGLMVRHLLPAAFADVSDVWALPRRARVAVFLAGPASTAVWASLAMGVWVVTPYGSIVHLWAGALMLAGVLTTLIGLNPVAGYDGSEVLAEWLELPDLHRRALAYGWGLLRGRPPQASPRERRVLGRYGLAFLLYNVLVVALILVVVLSVFLG